MTFSIHDHLVESEFHIKERGTLHMLIIAGLLRILSNDFMVEAQPSLWYERAGCSVCEAQRPPCSTPPDLCYLRVRL